MFDRLFDCPRAQARQRAGPLTEERLRFLAHQAERGLARRTLRDAAIYLLVVARRLRLADRSDEIISRTEIEQQARRWGDRLRPTQTNTCLRSLYRFRQYATDWLAFLGRLQPTAAPPPHPFAREIAAFAEYQCREKGLAPATVAGRCLALRQLLGRLGPACPLGQVSAARLDDALTGQAAEGHYSRRTIRDCAGTLRAFFHFAAGRGWCPAGLAAAIQAPRVYAQEGLPFGPSWDEVRQLLARTEGDRPDDIRDRALLLLLAVYGLRAGEVVRLRLEDFDWERESVTVTRSKSGRPRTYPLVGSVGAAVLRYVKDVRPRAALREVFLARSAPRRPLHRCCLYVIVARRLRAASPGLPRFGPHALRHACATHLLDRGLSLKEIGDHLGHRSPDTTRIYTKVNLPALRRVAAVELGGVL